jgi:hypothetical protein
MFLLRASLTGAAVLVALIVSASCAVPSSPNLLSPTSTVTVTYVPPPPPGQPKTTFGGDGTYQVGIDIAPGTYRSAGKVEGPMPFCSWKRLRSLDTNDIIDINNSAGPQVVVIRPTDAAFWTQGCQPWTKAD